MTSTTKPAAPKAPRIIKHSGMVVVTRPDGTADLINPGTGRWQPMASERAAKWSATVYTRLSAGFDMAHDHENEAFNQ